jgi:hypothetical protein
MRTMRAAQIVLASAAAALSIRLIRIGQGDLSTTSSISRRKTSPWSAHSRLYQVKRVRRAATEVLLRYN